MNAFAITFLVANVALLFLLPRRWAPLPLLIGACYITRGQGVELGPFSFSVIRLLIGAGIVRVIIRGNRFEGGMNGLDKLMLVWGLWALVSSIFHVDPSVAFITRLGLVYDALGVYFLLRSFCQSFEDAEALCRVAAIVLVPVALEMVYEKLMVFNLFSVMEGGSVSPVIRHGRIRAQGPFAHSILAGTIGAVSLPLMIAIWRQYPKTAFAGIMACVTMIITSASSGPVMSAIAAIVALFMWFYSKQMRLLRWLAVVGYVGLALLMNDPVYFLIARVDVAGGSTGWHRARVIESTFEHLSEWWLGGTDYTRHWMPTGVSFSTKHSDITNHYLQLGIIGGLPLMLLFIAILIKGFSFVGQALQKSPELTPRSQFMVWVLGASLFAFSVTFMGVYFYDQSFLFIYLTLALISSTQSWVGQLQGADNTYERNLARNKRMNKFTNPLYQE